MTWRVRAWVAAMAILLAVVTIPPATLTAVTPSRPNFVVIVTDDQRWDTIGRCLGGFDALDLAAGADSCMPNVQSKLVANGVTFLRGEVTQSLCCPSRSSIFTGQLTTHTGVTQVAGFDDFDDRSTVATWLHDAGYRTGLFGKYLNGYGDSHTAPDNYIPPGWDSWHGYYGYDALTEDPYTNFRWIDWDKGGVAVQAPRLLEDSTSSDACADGNQYSTDLMCAQSLTFLRSESEDPFFLYVAPGSPHEPPIPAARWDGAFASVEQPIYPSYNAVPSPNPPGYLPAQPLGSGALGAASNAFRNALETNGAVDDMVGTLYEELEADGRLDDTVFVFISDNGVAAGEHRWTTKQCEYEDCHRVPLIVVCPPAFCPEVTPGSVDATNYALNVDLAPTIADLAGVTPTLREDGLSLVPILADPSAAWRTSWFLHDQSTPLDGVVSTQADGTVYKYVEFSGSSDRELFDLTADPWELTNLHGDAAYSAIEGQLAALLADGLLPPVVSVTGGPTGLTNQTTAVFQFASDEDASFECSLDGAPPSPCGAGPAGSQTYGSLAQGSHTFSVFGVDEYNNVSSAASRAFTVDSVPPPTPTFTQLPANPSGSTVTFSFTDSEPGGSFTCSLDGAPAATCTSPTTLTSLANGSHTYSVTSRDNAGNDSTPATYTWTVQATTMTVTITAPAIDAIAISTAINVTWTASTGFTSYNVYQRIGLAGTQTLAGTARRTRFNTTGSPGTTTCFQIGGVVSGSEIVRSDERCVGIPFDDRSPSITYTGTISTISGSRAYLGTLSVLDASGEQASISSATMRKVSILMQVNGASGFAAISVDGALVATVDLYARRARDAVAVYTATLPSGAHTITVAWTGVRNAASSGTAISLDGIGLIS
jgi:arylsulfatase A-like enzyme